MKLCKTILESQVSEEASLWRSGADYSSSDGRLLAQGRYSKGEMESGSDCHGEFA